MSISPMPSSSPPLPSVIFSMLSIISARALMSTTYSMVPLPSFLKV
jgi:hypothetical protein